MRKVYLFSVFAGLLGLISHVPPAARAQSQPEPGTGLEGVILAGPVRGGPSRQGVPDSAPLANTEFVVEKGNTTVATFSTDQQGRFQISLPPGHYRISKKGPRVDIGSYGPFEVDVTAGQVKKVQWNCDTGIR